VSAPYELYVLCRKEPPAPPEGWGSRVWGIDVTRGPVGPWKGEYVRVDIDVDASFVCQVRLKRNDARATGSIVDLARGLADASSGVVLKYMPVTIPALYRVDYTGMPLDVHTWDELEAHIKRVAADNTARAEAQRAAEMARWNALQDADPDGTREANDWSDVKVEQPAGASTELITLEQWVRTSPALARDGDTYIALLDAPLSNWRAAFTRAFKSIKWRQLTQLLHHPLHLVEPLESSRPEQNGNEMLVDFNGDGGFLHVRSIATEALAELSSKHRRFEFHAGLELNVTGYNDDSHEIEIVRTAVRFLATRMGSWSRTPDGNWFDGNTWYTR